MDVFDVIVIGAGMAGASVAAELAENASVLVLEREKQPGYHSTGRSAAAYIPSYGFDNPSLRLLTECSLNFLANPPADFQVQTLLHRRGLLSLCPPDCTVSVEAELEKLQARIPNIVKVGGESIRQRVPIINDEYSKSGWFEPDVFDMDVHALHLGYLKALKQAGGQLVSNCAISALTRDHGVWTVSTDSARYSAPVVVNAAGAWADELATLAGVDRLGLMPLRRTAVLLDPPVGCDVSAWPLVMGADGSFYLKPDAGLILASPADENPSMACDAQPEELDIAYAVDFAQKALNLDVKQVRHSWAGLRTFARDRTPVIGFDPCADGFFWLAGQGGHGIQIAPAAARLAASLIFKHQVPLDLEEAGFKREFVAPDRLSSRSEEAGGLFEAAAS